MTTIRASSGLPQQCLTGAVRSTEALDILWRQERVRHALPCDLPLARGDDARPDFSTAFRRNTAHHRIRLEARHFDLDVDSIEQRTRDAIAISKDSLRRAVTTSGRMTEVSARTGIHRRDELELRRKLHLSGGARDVNASRLERLTQHFEHATIELGQLVEKQHAVMRERDLARPRIAAATNECDSGCRVVGRTVRTMSPGCETKLAGQ